MGFLAADGLVNVLCTDASVELSNDCYLGQQTSTTWQQRIVYVQMTVSSQITFKNQNAKKVC